jgi:hypothetical protein
MEVNMGPVDFLFRSIDPLKNPAGHGQRRGRHMGSGCIEAFHNFGKVPVGRGCFRIHLQGTDTGPGNFGNGGLCCNRCHRPHDDLPVCPAVQQGARDHVTRCTVKGIENKDPHYQYL